MSRNTFPEPQPDCASYALHTPHSKLRTPHSTLQYMHSTLQNAHSTLQNSHSTLHTPNSTLQTPNSRLQTVPGHMTEREDCHHTGQDGCQVRLMAATLARPDVGVPVMDTSTIYSHYGGAVESFWVQKMSSHCCILYSVLCKFYNVHKVHCTIKILLFQLYSCTVQMSKCLHLMPRNICCTVIRLYSCTVVQCPVSRCVHLMPRNIWVLSPMMARRGSSTVHSSRVQLV